MINSPPETALQNGNQRDRLAHEQAFIDELARQDKSRLAVLRRNAGNSLNDASKVDWIYSLLTRYSNQWQDEAYFLVATLFASDKDAIEGRNKSKCDFGATMLALKNRTCKTESSQKTFDRRFNILLDTDFDSTGGGELAFRLRQAVKRIISEKDSSVRVDWPQLLYDIKHWSQDRKWVQKQWARSYYAPSLNVPENAGPEPVNNNEQGEYDNAD